MRAKVLAASIIGVGACGFLLAFAVGASADIADMRSPYQPAATALVAPDGRSVAGRAVPVEASPVPEAAIVPQRKPTAAPESNLRPVPATERAVVSELAHPAPRTIDRVRGVFHRAGTFLGEVASVCKVGVAGGAGGPVLLLAVLSMAVALSGRGALGLRRLADEEPPEFLFAWDVIAPG